MLDELEPYRRSSPVVRHTDNGGQRKGRTGDWFLKGPIPGPWLQIASGLPGRALHVGLAIWFLIGLTKQRKVRVTSQTLRKFSIPSDAYRRGLKQLESAGLVDVTRALGRCATVTLKDTPDRAAGRKSQ
jgi:hypothetical protein